MRAFLGTANTGGQGSPARGIGILDVHGPSISVVSEVEAPDPMYLALSGDGRVLYSLVEREDGKVAAWTVSRDQLTPLGEARSAHGASPCHLSVHPSGRFLLSACYGSGTLAVHPINDDGSLAEASDTVQHSGSGPDETRQTAPHAHMIVTDATRGHVLAADLGTDTVYRYILDESAGTLALVDELRTPAGAGPRHLVIRGDYAYVANELDSTVTVMGLAAGQVLATTSTRPVGAGETSHPSAIRFSADGRYLYVANRFVDEIAVLSVDGPDVTLVGAVRCGGDHPRDMVLSPDGTHLYSLNQFADTITVFRLDQVTGMPEPASEPFTTASPTCLVWARP